VNFAEFLPDDHPETRLRRDFVAEENRAQCRKVEADLKCAAHRRQILETLQDVRADEGSESEHESDKMDMSRSTASLESELNARLSYGEEWRYYRSDGGHGQD
jgi:hypothetical protein